MLEFEPDMEVVGEAGDGEEALRQVHRLSPDVVVMDVRMPGTNGLQAAQELQEVGFPGKVLFISMYDGHASEAIGTGASGYLSKSAKLDEIVSAIRKIGDGESVFGTVA
ncbi:MAG: response regulator transcription factor [Chloroflexi bacterium]|nr:response regulator transcription factor [Chloroflexota bacterium]